MIKVYNADTDLSPASGSSNASRSTVTTGMALVKACKKLVEEVSQKLSKVLNLQLKEIKYEGGRFITSAGSFTLFQAVKMINEGKSLRIEFTYNPPEVEKKIKGMKEAPRFFYTYDVVITKVAVDTLTGKITVKEMEHFVDAGNIINHLIAESQVEGAAIQGLGFALYEELKYSKGIPLNINYTTYIVPSSKDVPKIKTYFVESYENLGPFGAKGIGEIGLVPVAPAISNAVRDALGISVYELPLKAEKVIEALEILKSK